MSKRILIIGAIIFLLITFVIVVFYNYNTQTKDLQDQEDVGEEIAEEYLIYVSQQINNSANDNEENESNQNSAPSDFEYSDNEIYSYFDESYAKGYVDCVIEIPAIDLRQSIFSGTSKEIEHDLSRWLAVTSRSDYVLGSTRYCIYMHNPTDKSIKISYAQEKLVVNDYIVVTQKNNVFLYKVTGVFPEWRDKCEDMYVDDVSVGSDKLYIFTCGRHEWQGRNVVIEGTVYDIYNLNDWMENKDFYISKYKKSVNNIVEQPPKIKEYLIMTVEANGDLINVSLKTNNYTKVDNCSIGVFNSDGYLIDNIANPIEYTGDTIAIDQLEAGEYYIGMYENNTEYSDPLPYKITIDKKTLELEISQIDDDIESEKKETNKMKIIAIFMLSSSVLLGVLLIIKTIINNYTTKNNRENE